MTRQQSNTKSPNKEKNRKSKSTLRVFTEILLILLFVEFFAYRKLSQMEFEDLQRMNDQYANTNSDPNDEQDLISQIVSPTVAHQQNKNRNKTKVRRPNVQKMKDERIAEKKEQQSFNLMLDINEEEETKHGDKNLKAERLKTAKKLEHMGISGDILLSELPPWSQIQENFNSYSMDDEPVILGLEQCEAFRKNTPPRLLGVAPAGMFSTGTNLIATLVRRNCVGPHKRIKGFALIQVPYGKHNPADARFYHQVKNPQVRDRDAILPIVAIRHPYTWMSAMCHHSYRTRWRHQKPKCHESLFLENPVLGVPYGFKQYNETHNVTNTYKSLAHMWLEWYKPYFLDQQYNQTPRLMVRHEDLVYRPEKVVSKICECVGGTNFNDNPDWEAPGGFEYEEESANAGPGHGKLGRSGLFKAFVRYGQPLRNWYEQYNGSDRKIMHQAFQEEPDPQLRQIFETFQYTLFDDVDEPTKAEKMRARRRAWEEQKEKEAALKAKEEQED